jgi:hypothetical protein
VIFEFHIRLGHDWLWLPGLVAWACWRHVRWYVLCERKSIDRHFDHWTELLKLG